MKLRPFACIATALLSYPMHAADVPPPVAHMWSIFDALRAAAQQNQTHSFRISEGEANDYLSGLLRMKPRPGMEKLSIKFFPNNYISTYTVLDFDAVEKWHPGTIPAMLRPVLSGRQALWLDIRIRTSSGSGTFSVEKAYFGNLRVPAVVVEKVISVVAARQPEHYDTTRPLPLPFGLKTVWTDRNSLGGTT